MQIYEALKKDHDKIKMLLNQLLMMGDQDEARRDLVEQIHDELIPHARAEEAVFYNSIRSIDIANDTVMQSYREHVEAETLLKTLQAKDKMDMDWRKTTLKLQEALEHHIEEEETHIFNMARELFTDEEATKFAEAFEELKPKIKEEGVVGTTIDLIKNLMPPRFMRSFRGQESSNLNR